MSNFHAYDHILQRFLHWAESQDDLRAVIVIGSQARTETPADQWSDLDLLLLTVDPTRYLAQADWLEALPPHWLTFTEPTATGGFVERRVLFDGALDVDFIPIPLNAFQRMLDAELPREVGNVLAHGTKFLLDKDGLSVRLEPGDVRPAGPPSAEAYRNLVNDFWYHAVWTTKKLLRGELWTALSGHAYLRNHGLLPMLAWHAKTRHGEQHETWHGGRFLETWADSRAIRELPAVFPRYDRQDLEHALIATMRLFSWLAREVADRLAYEYPHTAEERVTAWVNQQLQVH